MPEGNGRQQKSRIRPKYTGQNYCWRSLTPWRNETVSTFNRTRREPPRNAGKDYHKRCNDRGHLGYGKQLQTCKQCIYDTAQRCVAGACPPPKPTPKCGPSQDVTASTLRRPTLRRSVAAAAAQVLRETPRTLAHEHTHTLCARARTHIHTDWEPACQGSAAKMSAVFFCFPVCCCRQRAGPAGQEQSGGVHGTARCVRVFFAEPFSGPTLPPSARNQHMSKSTRRDSDWPAARRAAVQLGDDEDHHLSQ